MKTIDENAVQMTIVRTLMKKGRCCDCIYCNEYLVAKIFKRKGGRYDCYYEFLIEGGWDTTLSFDSKEQALEWIRQECIRGLTDGDYPSGYYKEDCYLKRNSEINDGLEARLQSSGLKLRPLYFTRKLDHITSPRDKVIWFVHCGKIGGKSLGYVSFVRNKYECWYWGDYDSTIYGEEVAYMAKDTIVYTAKEVEEWFIQVHRGRVLSCIKEIMINNFDNDSLSDFFLTHLTAEINNGTNEFN